jgi:glycosyltransferase involved in cell wall biosynthesis
MLLENEHYPEDTRVSYEARSLVSHGYSVRVIAPRGPAQAAHEVIDGVVAERFRLRLDHEGRARQMVAEYLTAHPQLWARGARAVLTDADVLHLHNPPDTLFVPALLAHRRGCRVVFDQHDLFPELVAEKLGSGTPLALARRAQRMTIRLADLTIATNESHRESAIAAGADPGRVIVVRNGIPRDAQARAQPVRPGALDDPHLLFVGALGRQDGVMHLADVLRSVVADQQLSGARMTVVGYGEEREPLERRCVDLGVRERVTFTGRVSHQRVLELIAGADICLDTAECTAFNHRTTMVKIVEYLSLARPTVAFALRETSRTVLDAAALADCGDWAQFTGLIAAFARSERRRSEYSERARKRSQGLTWEHSEAELLSGYERMLAARG